MKKQVSIFMIGVLMIKCSVSLPVGFLSGSAEYDGLFGLAISVIAKQAMPVDISPGFPEPVTQDTPRKSGLRQNGY
jgi:hypothetical protein